MQAALPAEPPTVKDALTATKRLYEALEQARRGKQVDYKQLKRQAKLANAVLVSVQRRHADEIVAARVERDALRAEMHGELVDREANGARVSDRQRVLFERATALPGQSAAQEKAQASASFVEAAISSLCPHAGARSAGCDLLG
jgi:hypothetical protein